jgi:hypothetical protein
MLRRRGLVVSHHCLLYYDCHLFIVFGFHHPHHAQCREERVALVVEGVHLVA